MRHKHKCGSHDHPRCSLSDLVHKGSEKRREKDGEERNHGKKHCRDIEIHAEKRKQDRHAELLETDHTAVECHTEKGDHQEARIAQHLPYIGNAELVLLGSLDLVGLSCFLIEFSIHGDENRP